MIGTEAELGEVRHHAHRGSHRAAAVDADIAATIFCFPLFTGASERRRQKRKRHAQFHFVPFGQGRENLINGSNERIASADRRGGFVGRQEKRENGVRALYLMTQRVHV